MNLLRHTHIDFLKYRRFWMAASLLVSLVGLVIPMIPGAIKMGIDFSGGTQIIARVAENVSLDRTRSALARANVEAQIQRYGEAEDHAILIRVADDQVGGENHADHAVGAVRKALEAEVGSSGLAILSQEYVGPQIAAELRTKGLLAVVLSSLGILVYLWYRFELRFAVGTVVAMAHDVLVTLALYTTLGFEFNLTTIAAFLTLVGYSVNDTVVIFDRVRENLRQHRQERMYEVLNRSLNQTLSRTLLTSGTTMLAAGALLAFGGPALRGFAFIITVGVVVGTYSSVYVASPIVLLWDPWFGHRDRDRQVGQERQKLTSADSTRNRKPATARHRRRA
jgi:preprotein translocase subunit SecF